MACAGVLARSIPATAQLIPHQPERFAPTATPPQSGLDLPKLSALSTTPQLVLRIAVSAESCGHRRAAEVLTRHPCRVRDGKHQGRPAIPWPTAQGGRGTKGGPFASVGKSSPAGPSGCGGRVGAEMSGVSGARSGHSRALLPQSSGGWCAVASSVVGLGSFLVLPVMTVTLRDTYPVTDTWVMPAILAILVGIAAVVNGLCVWRRWDQSIVTLAAASVTIPVGLFAVLMVIGEGLAGT